MDITINLSPAAAIALIVALAYLSLVVLSRLVDREGDEPRPDTTDGADPVPLNFPELSQ